MTPRHKRSRWQHLLRRMLGAQPQPQPGQQPSETITRTQHQQEIQNLRNRYTDRENELLTRLRDAVDQLAQERWENRLLRDKATTAWAKHANTHTVSAPAPAGSEDPTLTTPIPLWTATPQPGVDGAA